jgi:hypothetical protein
MCSLEKTVKQETRNPESTQAVKWFGHCEIPRWYEAQCKQDDNEWDHKNQHDHGGTICKVIAKQRTERCRRLLDLASPSNENKMSCRERERAWLRIEGLNSWKTG